MPPPRSYKAVGNVCTCNVAQGALSCCWHLVPSNHICRVKRSSTESRTRLRLEKAPATPGTEFRRSLEEILKDGKRAGLVQACRCYCRVVQEPGSFKAGGQQRVLSPSGSASSPPWRRGPNAALPLALTVLWIEQGPSACSG